MADKGKPYLIEFYGSDGALVNKFKFVLAATNVRDLKEKIVEKLVAKNQLTQDDKIAIKDVDDYELGSDDEVADVVPDGRVKIHMMKIQSIPKVEAPVQQSPPQTLLKVESTTSIQTGVNLSSTNSLPTKIGIEVPIIDLQNWTIPQVPLDFPKQKTLQIVCPQIRKTAFALESVEDLTFYELSKYIIKQFNLSPQMKALIYTSEGQPLLFNLDLIHTKVPKLDYSRTFHIIFTATKTQADQMPVTAMEATANLAPIKILYNKRTSNMSIDLSNSLYILKYKIFTETGIHPTNQIIKYANNALTNDAETLEACGIKAQAIVELNFKVISNIVPSTYTDRFYYKDVELLHPQQVSAYRFFKSNILAFGFHLSNFDDLKFLSFIRMYSANEPFVCALRALFNKLFLSQAHRIALEEGFYTAIWHYLKGCNPAPSTEPSLLFNHTRDFLGFVLEALNNTSHSNPQFEKREEIVIIQNNCSLTTKPITSPALIKLDDDRVVLIDRNEMFEQIDKGYTFPLLKEPKKNLIFDNYSLLQNFEILKFNEIDSSLTPISIASWQGSELKPLNFTLPPVGEVEKYEPVIQTKYNNLKIHKPLEIKNKSSIYLILLNKENEHRIFVSKNKDINKPHNIFDVISGKEEAVNLDLMMAAGKTENLEEHVDAKDLKPVITREPKQAIVVLFDVSGSMGGKFFNEADLKRIGACKLFFEALAYRTIAYSFEHVVSLTFFDYEINIQCDFTEAIYDFNRLVSAAQPRGSTMLYDSIMSAVHQLQGFKTKYPECILRILALTDGEDTGSKHSIFDATKAVVTNDIVMDSFAVGANCDGLKTITLASGGKCYLTRNLEESLKLFEQETVLSVRSRVIEPLAIGKSDQDIERCIEKAKFKPFDMGDNVHEFKRPEIKGPGLSSKQIAQRYQSEEGQKKISGNASLKRISKQIQNYNDNPHPFVAIFPCENINVWKILLLGPKQTPYENGLFLLYANFPGDYPFRAPEVRFITPIYHCNMNQQGRICHSVFDRNYSPALSFRHIVDCVYGLILTPEPEDPLDNVIASYFLSEYPKYLTNAKEATKTNASKTTEQLVEQIFGKIADDIERQKRVEELNKWIEKAKTFN